jgi:hypothetical protein
VTDTSHEVIPTHYEQLKALEWMVGSWTDEAADAEVELDCNWTKNKNFLTRAFKVSIPDQSDFSGMQIIGWDPAAKTMRPLVHPPSRRPTRRTFGHHDQRDEAGGRELLYVADD